MAYGGYTEKEPFPYEFMEALILNSVDYEVSYNTDWADRQIRETAYKFSEFVEAPSMRIQFAITTVSH
jgi:hypothetical protein